MSTPQQTTPYRRWHANITVRKIQRLIEEQGVERILSFVADALDSAKTPESLKAQRCAKAIRGIP